jgi:hypothetical protein
LKEAGSGGGEGWEGRGAWCMCVGRLGWVGWLAGWLVWLAQRRTLRARVSVAL